MGSLTGFVERCDVFFNAFALITDSNLYVY